MSQILYIIFFSFFVFILVIAGVSTGAVIFISLSILLITLYFLSKGEQDKIDSENRSKESEKYNINILLTEANKIINRHEKILAKKYSECIFVDDYGKEFFDNTLMDKNISYFYNKILVYELTELLEKDNKKISAFSYESHVRKLILDKSRIANRDYKFADIDIENLDSNSFEHECANILRKSGWKATVTKKTGDNGIDIIGFKNNNKYVFQCKKYSKPVGIKAVQEIHGGKAHERADYAYVVTNNTFTSSAHALAKKTGVILLHYSDLENL